MGITSAAADTEDLAPSQRETEITGTKSPEIEMVGIRTVVGTIAEAISIGAVKDIVPAHVPDLQRRTTTQLMKKLRLHGMPME